MKKIIIAMAAMVAAFAMVSCNKELPADTSIVGSCIVTASTEGSLTKTAIIGDDAKGYEVVWSEGDTFKLRGETFTLVKGAGTTSGTFQGNVPSGTGRAVAYYPASYDGSKWPTEQTYKNGNITGSPMKADVYIFQGEMTDTKVEFKNVGGILRLTVKGSPSVSVTSITVCTDSTPDITLDCGTGVGLDDTKGIVFHIAMPEGTYTGTSILFMTSDNRHSVKALKADKPLVIKRSEITAAAIKVDKWSNNSTAPDGALPEPFTVSANGKKVYLSKGNLYCDDYYSFGFSSSQLSLESGQLSHFYWSRGAKQACDEEFYEYDVFMDDVLFTNSDSESPNPDFTANGQKGLWRALSADEWSYLTSNNSVWTTIKGVSGLVIFCDGYTGSKTGPFQDIPDGCAFLPAAGYRKPDSYEVISSGTEGRYLTSEPRSNSESCYARALCFNSDVTTMGAIPLPESGSCVRLVTDVPDGPVPTFNVTFDANGHGTAPAQYTGIKYHTTITKPTDPTTGGYTFLGWYKDRSYTAKWDFAKDVVTSNVTLYARWLLNGALPGIFTVDSSGKKVEFAKGNLWCDQYGTFKFEDNQYDYSVIWDKESGALLRDDTHVSHFMWSKNADVARALVYDDPSASKSDVIFTNATQTTPNSNFTVNGQKGMWHTLSNDEWIYLIKNNGSLRTTIMVNDNYINGLIVFCDGYSGSRVGLTEIPEGCAFLPAAGMRDPSGDCKTISHAGFYGSYWTASQLYEKSAFEVRLIQDVTTDNVSGRDQAQSVRLVTDVE